MATDNFGAFQYAARICTLLGNRYSVSPFDADRVQVITPAPGHAAVVWEALDDAGIPYRRNGNDVVIDVPHSFEPVAMVITNCGMAPK